MVHMFQAQHFRRRAARLSSWLKPGACAAQRQGEPLVTHTFGLEDYGEALPTFGDRIDGALKCW